MSKRYKEHHVPSTCKVTFLFYTILCRNGLFLSKNTAPLNKDISLLSNSPNSAWSWALAIQVVSKDVPVKQLLSWRRGPLLFFPWWCDDQAKRVRLVATAQVFKSTWETGSWVQLKNSRPDRVSWKWPVLQACVGPCSCLAAASCVTCTFVLCTGITACWLTTFTYAIIRIVFWQLCRVC